MAWRPPRRYLVPALCGALGVVLVLAVVVTVLWGYIVWERALHGQMAYEALIRAQTAQAPAKPH